MNTHVTGLHHVTAIASDPRRNLGFYRDLLGLRLVKKTVNFDDPSAYHLYYGNQTGEPGTLVTFFYWPGAAARGRRGSGQMARLTFSAPPAALPFWRGRLERAGVVVRSETRFGEDVLSFADPDDIPIEIVAVAQDDRKPWATHGIPAEHALRGLHTAELAVARAELTESLLTADMDFRVVRREGSRVRLEAGPGGSGRLVDLVTDPDAGRGAGGSGTIHHVAWRVADDAAELAMRERLTHGGFLVSPVRDRSYFRSIYYRERNGILFEIATDVPGFAIDESVESLGTGLKLPSAFEPHRAAIERALPPLESTPASE